MEMPVSISLSLLSGPPLSLTLPLSPSLSVSHTHSLLSLSLPHPSPSPSLSLSLKHSLSHSLPLTLSPFLCVPLSRPCSGSLRQLRSACVECIVSFACRCIWRCCCPLKQCCFRPCKSVQEPMSRVKSACLERFSRLTVREGGHCTPRLSYMNPCSSVVLPREIERLIVREGGHFTPQQAKT